MASYYWAKVWIEILYDYKMASMSDHLWRRTIELVLLAKERNAEGYLPKLEEMAFKLRTNAEILEAELNDLAGFEIAERRQDGWYLINFADRQGKMEVAERVARHRDREKKREYNESETVVQRDSNDVVTNRYTEQNRIDKNILDETDTPKHSGMAYEMPPEDVPHYQHNEQRRVVMSALASVVKETFVIGDDAQERAADALIAEGIAEDDIRAFSKWWKTNGHYTGKPALKSLMQNIKESLSATRAKVRTDGAIGYHDPTIWGDT